MSKFALAIVTISFLLHWKAGSAQHSMSATHMDIDRISTMDIQFENVQDEKIKRSFIKVMERYSDLHACEVTLIQKNIGSSTMQAQPVIGIFKIFGKTETYRVKLAELVRDSDNIKVADLPEEVLVGWFAHELGHLMDYRQHNNLQMVFYGLRYVLSHRFKKEAEHTADRIAIRHGFRDEIIMTKKFILAHEHLGDDYKNKIKRYYMSIDDAEVWDHEHVPGTPKID